MRTTMRGARGSKHLVGAALLVVALALGLAESAAFASSVSGGKYIASIRAKAILGDAKAQFTLGGMYEQGWGGQVDLKQAAYWLQKAAEQGDPGAASALAYMYERGQGMPPDEAQAQIWYAKAAPGYRDAADRGDVQAQFVLGLMYQQGHGVPRDPPQAALWFRKAAERGHVDAGLELAWMYAHGPGVPRDLVQAHKWLTRYAHVRYGRDGTPPGAIEDLAAVAAQMTPAQLAEAKRLEDSGATGASHR